MTDDSKHLKKTPLNDWHRSNRARLVPFAGWEMPVQYSGIIEEHKTVRQKAGLFDISHMGEIHIEGREATAFIDKMVTKSIADVPELSLTYALFCYPNGTVVDDLMVYKFNQQKYMLIVNASNTDKDWEWLNRNQAGEEVRLHNVTDYHGLMALQGPLAEQILQGGTKTDLSRIKYLHFCQGYVCDYEVLLSRSGYTGEDGFEIACRAEETMKLWEMLLGLGAADGLKPIGLGARDSLRLEACYSLYGHEIDDRHTPLEAKLGWAVSLEKEFIGRAALLVQKENGLTRRLAGFEMIDRGIPRQGYEIRKDGVKIGNVVSGGFAPSLDKSIGLGFFEAQFTGIGTDIEIIIRDKAVAAKIVKTPFYKGRVKK